MVAVLTFLQLATAACFLLRTRAETVQYFYGLQKDKCAWGTNSIPADNNTLNGGLCAYVPSIKRVYACPAPDPACWTWGQQCANGGSPGPNQIQCNRGGTIWCCQNQETCTVTKGQINVCISQFYSLNSGVSPANAQAEEFSAIPSASIGTATVTALPSVISSATFNLANVGTSSISTSTTSASNSPSSSPSSTATTAGVSSVGVTTANASSNTSASSDGPTSRSNQPSLSGGAIAGIVIGALVAVAMICGTIIYVVKDRRKSQSGQRPTTTPSMVTDASYHPPSHNPTSYYEKSSTQLVEADSRPGDGSAHMGPYMGGRHELH